MDKRTFIKNIIRGFILVGIGAVFGKSLFKKKPSEPCNYVYLCKGCNKISDCQLDEAIKFRREKIIYRRMKMKRLFIPKLNFWRLSKNLQN